MNPITLVSPDKGAFSKVKALATTLGGIPFIKADKVRDPETGDLSGFSYEGSVQGLDLLIVDDICDGGGTFVGLAKILKEGGAKSISLYVSHGIFSKGLKVLDGAIDAVYTTDSLIREEGFKDGYTGIFEEIEY